MKKALTAIALLTALMSLSAQSDAAAPATGTAQTERYTVISEVGQADADKLASTLESYFALYDSYLHFDPAILTSRLQVRAFATKAAFDAYLTQVIGSTKDDFVYLHYPTLERSELLIYAKDDAEDYELSLAHQAFVQFIKAFAPGAPLWLREGFAVYFEQSRFDAATGVAAYAENLSWLETVKSYRTEQSLISVGDFLSLSADEAKQKLQVFYPQSWAFVAYLLESSDKASNRFLWDIVSKLARDKDADATQSAVYALAKTWPGIDALSAGFDGYLEQKRTFPEMVSYGISLYNDKNYEEAAKVFKAATEVNKANHVPFYYLGLIAYYQKDYAMAEVDYQQSLSLGCDPGIANYALGVNAFVMGRSEDARSYLALAKEAAPAEYGSKADEVLARIK
jgi:tetratricopeptide (TPR) repeat protein